MNTVTVKINGVEYNLKGKENEKYLLEVASYVDSKFREISANNNKLSTSSVAVLAALNIADEYFKISVENEDITKKRNLLEERHLTIKERLRELKAEIEEITKVKNSEIDSLKNMLLLMEEKLKEETSESIIEEKYIKEIDELNQEVSRLREIKESMNDEIKSKDIELEKVMKNNQLLNNEEVISLKSQISIMEQELKDIISEKDVLESKNKEMKFILQNSKYKVLDLEKKLIDVQFNLAVEKKNRNSLLK